MNRAAWGLFTAFVLSFGNKPLHAQIAELQTVKYPAVVPLYSPAPLVWGLAISELLLTKDAPMLMKDPGWVLLAESDLSDTRILQDLAPLVAYASETGLMDEYSPDLTTMAENEKDPAGLRAAVHEYVGAMKPDEQKIWLTAVSDAKRRAPEHLASSIQDRLDALAMRQPDMNVIITLLRFETELRRYEKLYGSAAASGPLRQVEELKFETMDRLGMPIEKETVVEVTEVKSEAATPNTQPQPVPADAKALRLSL